MLPPEAARLADRYLACADRLLPDRLVGFYVVGSAALGAYRVGRSDLDFVAVVDGDLSGGELRRLRLVHATMGGRSGVRAVSRGRLRFPGTANGVFVRADDLAVPVSRIAPVASHTGHQFSVGRGFDVNSVVWQVLAERGIAVRGPAPAALGLQPEPERLRAWNLDNLDRYWRRWAEAVSAGPALGMQVQPRAVTAWGVLGAPRLHHTIATGRVISKEAAGTYALDSFDRRWHPVIAEALAYWRGEPADPSFRSRRKRREHASGFVLDVIGDAHAR